MSRKHANAHRSTAAWLTGLVAMMGVVLVSASPARAGNEFRNGFEDELGRIAAHGVATAGAALLYHVSHAPIGVRRVVVEHRHHVHHPHPHHGHPRHFHHGAHRGHGHRDHWRTIPPCEIEHRETIRRDHRHGTVTRTTVRYGHREDRWERRLEDRRW